MARLIVVCGATGSVGGSVARRMLKEGWQVRAVTRNQESPAAKALAKGGATLVSANYDDLSSLEKAFDGASAIFGLTNIVEYLLDDGPDAAAEREKGQLLNIAKAAGSVSSLEHLVLHTLPSGVKLGGKEWYTPHLDGKAEAAEEIIDKMPEVAQKTTFLWIGMFPGNFVGNSFFKPVEIPGGYGAHVVVAPISPKTKLYMAGDLEQNVGTFVLAILAKPEVSLPAKYALVSSEHGTFSDYVQAVIDITGRRTTLVQCTAQEYEQIWGPWGKELALMFGAFMAEEDWGKGNGVEVLDAAKLGISSDDLVGHKASLEKSKHLL